MSRLLTASVLILIPVAPAVLAEEPKGDKDLDGEWQLKSLTENGEQQAAGSGRNAVTATVKGEAVNVNEGGTVHKSTCKADPSKTPRQLDFTPQDGDDKGKSVLAIYEVSGDELKVCHAEPGKDRPTEFSAKKGSGWTLAVFTRVKK